MLLQARTSTFTIAFTLFLCCVCGWSQETRDAHHRHSRETANDLGVAQVQLYAKAPVLLKEKVLLLNVWLKRVTWGNSSGSSTPDHSEVHGFAWAEDMEVLNRNQDGHMLMGVDPNVWQPRLHLETPRGGVVQTQPATDVVKDPVAKSSLRPFHFTFILDPKFAGRCFKIYEESFPGHRASFCLPLTPQRPCRKLVSEEEPTRSSSSGVPALWSLVFPVRSIGINGTHWEYYTRLTANRVFNYAVYQIGIGGAGLLVYADRMTRAGLERVPRIAGMVAKGRIILVTWDMPERSPMSYKYDQALVASHALLGLSPCGPSVMLLLADLDEYLYSAFGHGWPSIHACLAKADPRVTLHRIQRIDAASTRLEPGREAAWWMLPARSLARHPIMSYDRVRREALRPELSKVLAAPSGRVVGFYVHDGVPMYGTSHLASAECAFLLHIPNYWGPRAAVAAAAGTAAGVSAAAGTAAADSAAAVTVAAGGGRMDSFDSLFNLGGLGNGGGEAAGAVGGAAGAVSGAAGAVGIGGAAGAGGGGANGGAAVASSAEYLAFKVSAAWAVGPAATAALDTGATVGRAGGGGGRRRRGGSGGGGSSWRTGDDEDGGGGAAIAVGSGGGGAAAAATALAAANAAATVLAAVAATPTSTAQADGGSGGALAAEGGAIAADADRWAALAAEKARTRGSEEAKPAEVAGAAAAGGGATETAAAGVVEGQSAGGGSLSGTGGGTDTAAAATGGTTVGGTAVSGQSGTVSTA